MMLNEVQCLISWLSNDISIWILNSFRYADDINGKINSNITFNLVDKNEYNLVSTKEYIFKLN